MATAADVASYVLEQLGEMSARKLHKLVYYCQAWSLAWTGRPLFLQRIEAWVDGPVIPDLYRKHRQLTPVSKIEGGDSRRVAGEAQDTIDSVLAYYGGKSEQWLIDRTHEELPWQAARRGLFPWQRGQHVISNESMRSYYFSLGKEGLPR